MRVKASQFVTIAVLALGATCGFASSTKPIAHKPDAVSHTHSKAKPVAREPREVASRHAAPKAAKRVEVARTKHSAKVEKPAVKVVATREKAPTVARHVEPTLAPAPERVEPQEDIHVTHDRKQHFTAPSAATPAPARKATAADFLSNTSSTTSEPKPAAPAQSVKKAQAAKVDLKPSTARVDQLEVAPTFAPVLFTKRGRLIVPPAMKGSHEILLHQNEMADHDGLDRVRDDADLEQMRADNLLVPIPVGSALVEDERLPSNRRFCRPWTAQFLTAMSRAYYARFHTPLQVNSAVRTVEFQQRLQMTNGNAAPAEGDTASPHLTGQAIDLAKHGLSMTQIAWIRGYLLPLVQAGKVDVEEEFQQACFHISVYRKYVPEPAAKREIAGTHVGVGASIATAIR